MSKTPHLQIPVADARLRLKAAEENDSLTACVAWLKEKGHPVEYEALRSYYIRNRIEPRKGIKMTAAKERRLEAAEAVVDEILRLLESMPANPKPGAIAYTLGGIQAATKKYAGEVQDLREVLHVA